MKTSDWLWIGGAVALGYYLTKRAGAGGAATTVAAGQASTIAAPTPTPAPTGQMIAPNVIVVQQPVPDDGDFNYGPTWSWGPSWGTYAAGGGRRGGRGHGGHGGGHGHHGGH